MKLKAILALLIVVAYGAVGVILDRILTVPIGQSVALGQMEDSPESFTNLATFKLAWSLWVPGWIVIALIIFWMFWPNIKKAIKNMEAEENR